MGFYEDLQRAKATGTRMEGPTFGPAGPTPGWSQPLAPWQQQYPSWQQTLQGARGAKGAPPPPRPKPKKKEWWEEVLEKAAQGVDYGLGAVSAPVRQIQPLWEKLAQVSPPSVVKEAFKWTPVGLGKQAADQWLKNFSRDIPRLKVSPRDIVREIPSATKSVVGGVGEQILSAPIKTANLIAYPIIEAQARDELNKGKISYSTYKKSVDAAAQKADIGLSDSDFTIARKVAAPIAQTAMDVLTMGSLPGKLGKLAMPRTLGQFAGGGALFGGATGGLTTLGQEKPITLRGALENITAGTALGTLGGVGLGKVFGAKAGKYTPSVSLPKPTPKLTAEKLGGLAPSTPSPPKIVKPSYLTNEQQKISVKYQQTVHTKYQSIKDAYDQNNLYKDADGNATTILLNPDKAKSILDADISNAHLTHEGASQFIDIRYGQALDEMLGKGKNTFIALAGGGGSGKGYIFDNLIENRGYSIVMDKVFGGEFRSLIKTLKKAENKGYRREVTFVDMNPLDAGKNAINRSVSEGRPVPISELVSKNIGARNNTIKLLEKHPDIPVRVIDNNYTKGKFKIIYDKNEALDFLKKQKYNESIIAKELENEVIRKLRLGEISLDQAKGFTPRGTAVYRRIQPGLAGRSGKTQRTLEPGAGGDSLRISGEAGRATPPGILKPIPQRTISATEAQGRAGRDYRGYARPQHEQILQAEIVGTSFRPQDIDKFFGGKAPKTLAETKLFYSTPEGKLFDTNIDTQASKFNVSVISKTQVGGKWENSLEPSWKILTEVPDIKSGDRYVATLGKIRAKDPQDSMGVFYPGKGNGYRYEFMVSNPEEASKLLTKHGFPGSTPTDRSIIIYDKNGALLNNADSLAKELKATVDIQQGTAKFIDKNQYDSILAGQKYQIAGEGVIVPVNEAEAKRLAKQILGTSEPVKFVQSITTPEGKVAYGKYQEGMVTFANKVQGTTYGHEFAHYLKDKVIPDNTWGKFKLAIREADDLVAEERFAERMGQYVNNRTTNWGSNLKQVFSDIWNMIKSIVGKDDKIQTFIRRSFEGRYTGLEGRINRMTEQFEARQAMPKTQEVPTLGLPKSPRFQIKPEKERGFVKTVKEAPITSEEVRNMSQGYYTRITNQEALESAIKTINKDPKAALSRVLTTKNPDLQTMTEGLILAEHYQKTGQFEVSAQILQKLAESGTKLGQQIQILSVWSKTTPEGVVRYARKVIDDANKQIKSTKKLELSIEQEARARRQAEFIQSLPEGSREKLIATAVMLRDIDELVPSTRASRAQTGLYFAQLLNPKTAIRNIVGNLGFAATENISDVLATAMDVPITAIRRLFGQPATRTKYLPKPIKQAKWAIEGAKEAGQEARWGVNLKRLPGQFDVYNKPRAYRGKVGGALEMVLQFELSVPDRAFYNLTYKQSLYNQMKAAKVKVPTAEMEEIANFDGMDRTFQDESAAAKVFEYFKKGFNRLLGKKEFGLGNFVINYPKTPGNIVSRGIEYSGGGFVKAVMELGRPLFRQGAFNQKKFVESTSRALVGTGGLLGTGAMLNGLGIITGKPEKSEKVRALERETGLGAYKLNVSALKRFITSGFNAEEAKLQDGDTLVNYDWFLPASIPLSMGANINETKGSSKGSAAKIKDTLGVGMASFIAGINTLAEQPMMTGIKRLFGGGDVGAGLFKTAIEAPAAFVPTIANQIRQLLDNTARETYDPNMFKEALNKLTMKIPGLSSTLPPKVGVLGEDLPVYQPEGGGNNPFNVFLNPAFITKYVPDKVTQEVQDLYDRTGSTEALPRPTQGDVNIEGKKITLNSGQYEDYGRYAGTKTKQGLENLINSPLYQGLSDDEKVKLISNTLQDVHTAAKITTTGIKPDRVSEDVQQVLDNKTPGQSRIEDLQPAPPKTPKGSSRRGRRRSTGRGRKRASGGRRGGRRKTARAGRIKTVSLSRVPKLRLPKVRKLKLPKTPKAVNFARV